MSVTKKIKYQVLIGCLSLLSTLLLSFLSSIQIHFRSTQFCPALPYPIISYHINYHQSYSILSLLYFIKLSFICSTFLKSQLAQYPHLLCHHISPLPLPRPVSYFICSSSSSPFSSSPLLSLFLPPPPSFPPVLHLLVPC